MNRASIRAAIYARVSSEQQAKNDTIASQVDALRGRVERDGLALDPEMTFVDEGYSGGSLVRPALERLRDQAAAGALDRLYVLAPDRLARRYAYQVLLVDELHRCGVEVVFLDHPPGRTPEEELLLQVQGMVAEYERAKILERSRRGKRHAARRGSVSVLTNAPYGYRYIAKQDGGGQARYEIVPEQSRVVVQIFTWVGLDRCPLAEVSRRLRGAGGPYAHRQGGVEPDGAVGDAPEPGVQGRGDVRQAHGRAGPTAVAARARAAGAPAASPTAAGPGGRGADHDPGPRDRGRGPLRRRAGAVGGESGAEPDGVAGGPPPAPGPAGLRVVRLRPLRQGVPAAGGRRGGAGLLPTTAASGPSRTASGASGSAGAGRSAATCSTRRSGRMYGRCCRTPSGSERSMRVGSAAGTAAGSGRRGS